MAEKSFRIRTNVASDSVVRVNLEQDMDFLEVLSIKLSQEDNYRVHSSNYGIIVGRVLANDAFGIPNCKISVFIPLDDTDKDRSDINSIYPFTDIRTKDKNNIRYNLLPDEYTDECRRDVGTFPNKRLVLDSNTEIEVFDKYWKYTTVTNNAGDYMLYGVPVGSQTVHMDLDLSDIGILSQTPRDMIYKGYDPNLFDSPSQFRESTNLDNLSQIISQDKPVQVYPFWGDSSTGDIAISRCDLQVQYKFEPTCIFLGSVVTDDVNSSINQKCKPNKKSGINKYLTSSEGTIEMIRKTVDGYVEEFPIEANQLIDGDGVWCYQIPMNLDYIGTDEFGNIVRTDNPNKGIATRTSVRFRFNLQETGNEGVSRHRARYLVPNNPKLLNNTSEPMIEDGSEFDNCYEFGSNTPDEYFKDLYWNKIYSVKNYIPRVQSTRLKATRRYSALKSTNISEGKNPIPFNKLRIRLPFMFSLLCVLCKIVIRLIARINKMICRLDKIHIFRLRPFKIGCIGFNFMFDEDSGDEGVAYLPGCFYHRGQEYAECPEDGQKNCKKVWDTGDIIDKMEQTLGEEYEIANLDFYNDWLNGSLYFPLWFWKKTKKRKYLFGLISIKAKNKYCDCDKRFKKTRVTQSCSVPYKNIRRAFENGLIIAKKDETKNWHRIFSEKRTRYGIIKEVENKDGLSVYYYSCGIPPIADYHSKVEPVDYVRLYSTDIILLGSLNECSFDGLPKLYASLPSTTANIPMISSIIEDEGDDNITDDSNETTVQEAAIQAEETTEGYVETTGMDWTHTGKKDGYNKGLFFDLACTRAKTRLKTCVNVERLCELGVSMDASMVQYVSDGNKLAEDEYEADGLVTRHELIDNEARAMFATMNGLGLNDKVRDENTTYDTYKMKYVYPVDFDGKMKNLTRAYTTQRAHLTYDNFDKNYLKFRLGDVAHFYNSSFLLYENSFYFYFGLNEGRTALEKFYTKYYADCFKNDKKPFTYDYKTYSPRFCYHDEDFGTDFGVIKITLGKIKTPYSYVLYNEWGDELIKETGISDNILMFGCAPTSGGAYQFDDNGEPVKDGRLWYKNPESYGKTSFDKDSCYINKAKQESANPIYEYLTAGTYTVEIIDDSEKSASQMIILNYVPISMRVSASGLGMKYYGYAEQGSGETVVIDDEYNEDDTDGVFGTSGTTMIDSDDFNMDSVTSNTVDFESSADTNSDSILTTASERALTQGDYILKSVSAQTEGNKTNTYTDEKALICGNDKAGTIIIDEISIDGDSYEVIYIGTSAHTLDSGSTDGHQLYGLTSGSVTTALTDSTSGFSDTYEDGDFFLIVTNDSKQTPEGEDIRYVKLSIRPELFDEDDNQIPFSACSCDYIEGFGYDVAYKFPSGGTDVYGSYSSATISGGIYEYGDLDVYDKEDAHINFSVWRPGDYTITLTQYCDSKEKGVYELSDNYSKFTVTVENGGDFDMLINDVPIRFLLGNASAETEYNTDYFNPTAKYPKNIPGWFKVHLPSGYMFPSTDAENFELWLNYVEGGEMIDGVFSDEMKSRIIMYKFDAMFRMAQGVYVTNESSTNVATTTMGGQKPILYMGAYPNYVDEEEMSTYIVNTLGAADFSEVYPNIVGRNYRYKVTGKSNHSTGTQIIRGGIIRTKIYDRGHLYNDLMVPYVGVSEPIFNPEYSPNNNDNKYQYISVNDTYQSVSGLGNYFAAMTLNGGLTNTDYNGACRDSVEYSARTESIPLSAKEYKMCAGYEEAMDTVPDQIKEHYFRYETVDRRLDYDLFLYMPPYLDSGIRLNNECTVFKYGRLYGTVYNGVEMAYERAAKGVSGATKYNVIGKTKEDGLEYYYSMEDGNVYANLNDKNTSKNKRFYESFIKCGNKKYDITDMYYSGFHTPSGITSVTNLPHADDLSGTPVPLMLDAKGSSQFFYENEVNGDFSIDNYPTKRTINIANIPLSKSLTFNVTSCSYDMVSGIFGDEVPSVGNSQIIGGETEGNNDSTTYVITAETTPGEVCEVKIDTRDCVQVHHKFTTNDFELNANNYEIKYTTSWYKNSQSITHQVLMCEFKEPLNINLHYKIAEDQYDDSHDTFTSRPMIVNIQSVPTRSGSDEGKDDYSYENAVDFINEAFTNSISPQDITDNLRLNCRAQFVNMYSKPDTVKSKDDVMPSQMMPRMGKYDNCYMTQINYNRYPILVQAAEENCEIVRDDSEQAKEVIYRYGIFSYKRKRKTRYDSDWGDYFKYGRGMKKNTKMYYYHKDVASVCGVLYERNYINTNEDNLGKNIKLIKLCCLFDLRPFKMEQVLYTEEDNELSSITTYVVSVRQTGNTIPSEGTWINKPKETEEMATIVYLVSKNPNQITPSEEEMKGDRACSAYSTNLGYYKVIEIKESDITTELLLDYERNTKEISSDVNISAYTYGYKEGSFSVTDIGATSTTIGSNNATIYYYYDFSFSEYQEAVDFMASYTNGECYYAEPQEHIEYYMDGGYKSVPMAWWYGCNYGISFKLTQLEGGFSLYDENNECNVINAYICNGGNGALCGAEAKIIAEKQDGSDNDEVLIKFKWPTSNNNESDGEDWTDTPQFSWFWLGDKGSESKSKRALRKHNRKCAVVLLMKSGYYYTIPFNIACVTANKGRNAQRVYFSPSDGASLIKERVKKGSSIEDWYC